ncbi:MAG TPA: NAD(P)-dependent oxidoreductase, partial [Gemmatimonadaceae bacterium]|nr:NAD(P)-dependent oxidoreductase [Gemmatimonadaceae bacterium]
MILLTGGTGFVGRHLARQFVADRRPVRVLSRTPHLAALPDAVTWAQGDLGDPSSTRDALRDVHTVVHAAALDTGSTAASLEHTNVDGTTMLARIARDAGIRHFVHISSAGVYGDGGTPAAHRESDIPSPMTAYQRSKLAAEQTLMATLEGSGVPWTILRPPELYAADRLGTRIFFRNVARRRLWLHGPAHMLVQPTHVTDLVSAVLLVVDRERSQRQVINIGGARALELREWIAMVGERMNHSPLQFKAPGSMRGMATLAT